MGVWRGYDAKKESASCISCDKSAGGKRGGGEPSRQLADAPDKFTKQPASSSTLTGVAFAEWYI